MIAVIVVALFVVLTLMVGLCAGLLLPALGSARESARVVKSQQNLRTIGAALAAYAADNQGELPEAGADLAARLGPLTGGADVWIVPGEGGERVYYYVPLGRPADLKNPSERALMYEAPGLWKREGGNVLYADGSVRRTDGLAFRAQIDSMRLPDGSPWTPHKK
jgi:prepilin-type processing-associated H-X9-DG protein